MHIPNPTLMNTTLPITIGSLGLARSQQMNAHMLMYGCTNSTKIIKQGLDEININKKYKQHSTKYNIGSIDVAHIPMQK